jgi:hypothetical protein
MKHEGQPRLNELLDLPELEMLKFFKKLSFLTLL